MIKFADAKIHKKQPIDLWLVHEQKSVQIVLIKAALLLYVGALDLGMVIIKFID